MPANVVFRISGARLDPAVLREQFRDFSTSEVYKLFSQRTSDQLAGQSLQPGQHVVAVKIMGGPLLVLHASHAQDLFASANIPVRGDKDDVAVTSRLPWTIPRKGRQYGAKLTPADATIDWLAILKKDTGPAQSGAIVAGLAQQLDARRGPCLYTLLGPHCPCGSVAPEDTPQPAGWGSQPLLIFLHGTFAPAGPTFGALWDCDEEGKNELGALFSHYGKPNVLAFDHPSLTQTPLGNALALAERLPAGAILDFITHGPGGLIAEVLLRATRTDDTAHLDHYFSDSEQHQLAALKKLLREKSITVRRMVRVACPARGTLLASQRLDAYLSVCLWLARINGMAPEPAWFDLLNHVALADTPIDQLPGLAAMLPTHGLIRWLNAPLPGVDSELYVVAGDSEGDSLLAWLQTLVSDAFFWTDNDVVVQTRSMYGGVPRRPGHSGPKILLLRDDKITHFTYFQRRTAVKAMYAALLGKLAEAAAHGGADAAQELAAWVAIGPRSWGIEHAESLPAGKPPAPPDASKPWLVLIPDVFGSVLLDQEGNRLWLDQESVGNFRRLALPAAQAGSVTADHLASAFYGELRAHLERTHHVLEFPYDWRCDIDTSADALCAFMNQHLSALTIGEQPLRIVANGMGGLVVRAWHARYRGSWTRMITRPGARVMLLGVPQAGSWLPLRLFSGDETFGTLFSTALPISEGRKLRQVLARMPGIVQLQAGLSGTDAPLARRAQWRSLRSEEFHGLRERDKWHGHRAWGTCHHLDQWAIPKQALLDDAGAFWRRLDRALPDLLHDIDKLTLVAGTGYATVTSIQPEDNDLFFVSTKEGDRQLTLDSAALPGAPLWLIGAPHDALMRTPSAFGALSELLATGRTSRLPGTSRRGARAAPPPPQTLSRRLPSHGSRVFATQNLPELLAVAGDAEDIIDDQLSIKVHHGDLRFVREPLLIGHYRSMTLTGTEAAVDSLIDQRMSTALRTGVYPERTGSFQIFENGRHHHIGRRQQRYIPRPRAAIVVGLGEEGKLTAQGLSYTVRIGVLAYAERSTEAGEQQDRFELAVALVGSGGTGVTVSMAAVALLQGVQDANVRLRKAGWPVVATLTIVEVYLDRASEALRVLNMQAKSDPKLTVEKFLVEGDGSLRRPLDTSYRGAAYDFISALRSPESTQAAPVIAYSLDTRRARTEVRALRAQGPLVSDLVCRSANTTVWDRQIGRTLFNLLIPVEIEPYLTGSSDMLMELDATTAALPWELLDTDPPQASAQDATLRPWAIRSKVLRKLRVDDYRDQIIDAATEDKILVIGDPLTPGPYYPPLEGARQEADGIAAVARTSLGVHREHVIELNNRPDATTIINALFAHRYRIVHIAGHGAIGDQQHGGGVVLSGADTFLGASEVKAMRVTPELVFLNCCHLAKVPGQLNYDRVVFAANIARELIGIGVRCVIAAGWAIEDDPAQVFATTFYREIFEGRRFIDAVGAARNAAYERKKESNTWAAYQCYGDPDWSWKAASGSILPTPEQEYEGVAAPATLILVLQAITTDLLYATSDTGARNRARLNYLEKRFAHWTGRGAVAQEFAAAFAALPDRDSALKWYEKSTKAKDGTGSITAVELRAEQLSLPGASIKHLQDAIGMFSQICTQHGPSLRRLAMSGNAYRRLSMQLLKEPSEEAHRRSLLELDHARREYQEAAKCEPEAVTRFYPLRAAIGCKVRLSLLKFHLDDRDSVNDIARLLDTQADCLERELAEVSLEIQRGLRDNPNFWPIVAQSELEILKGVIKMNLAARQKDISASLRDLYKRINTRRFWAYVYDDALALLGLYQDVFAQDVQPAELEAANTLLTELRDYSLGAKKPDTTGKAGPHEPPVVNDTRSSTMGTHTFESEAELQSFLADHLTTTMPVRGLADQSQATLLSSLAPIWVEADEPRTRASISALRWVIRDEDLKLLDAIISGITLSASAGFLLSAVVSPSAMSTAIINITVALMKLLYNAHQKGTVLSKEDFALISLLKSKPDGLQAQEISSRLEAAGISWPPEELQRRLRSLLEVPTRSGKVALVWESAEHVWRSSGV